MCSDNCADHASVVGLILPPIGYDSVTPHVGVLDDRRISFLNFGTVCLRIES